MIEAIAGWLDEADSTKEIMVCLEFDERMWIKATKFETFEGGFRLVGIRWTGFFGYDEEVICREADLVAVRRKQERSISLIGKELYADADDKIPF